MDNVILTSFSPADLRHMIRAELEAFHEVHNKDPFDVDERLTRKDICKLYKVSLPTVHECMKRGLPYEKCGRKTLFKRSDVDQFFANRKGVQ